MATCDTYLHQHILHSNSGNGQDCSCALKYATLKKGYKDNSNINFPDKLVVIYVLETNVDNYGNNEIIPENLDY